MLEGVRLCVSGLPKAWPGRSEQDLQETARFWIACRAVAMARVMLAWKGAPPPLPPTSLSLDRDAVNVSELSALLAATGQNCLQFPITYPDGSLVQAVHPPKLRLALRNSTVVVSIHMRGEIPGGDYMQREESDSAEEAPLPSLAQDLNFSWLKTPLFPALYRPPARRRLIAFGRATSDHTLTASLYDLAVAPSLQRRGFGRQVLQRIIRDLGRRGITDIAALTSPEQRPFFIACGFAEDELNSTTMLYTRSSTLTNKDCVKQFGRKHLLVPAALKSACMPPLEHHHTDRS